MNEWGSPEQKAAARVEARKADQRKLFVAAGVGGGGMLAFLILVLILGSSAGALHAGFGRGKQRVVTISSPSPYPSPSPVAVLTGGSATTAAAVPTSTDGPTPEGADPASPTFDVGADYCGNVYFDPGNNQVDVGDDVAVEPSTPTYSTCADETAWSHDPLDLSKVTKGEHLCVRTDESRYAEIDIVGASTTGLTFSATVWDPQIQD